MVTIVVNQSLTPKKIEFFDLSGRKLLDYSPNKSNNTHQIETTGLTNGTFIIQIIFSNGSVGTKKWIKL